MYNARNVYRHINNHVSVGAPNFVYNTINNIFEINIINTVLFKLTSR